MNESDNVIIEPNIPQGDEFTPIHRMNPTQIKNEKIDSIKTIAAEVQSEKEDLQRKLSVLSTTTRKTFS